MILEDSADITLPVPQTQLLLNPRTLPSRAEVGLRPSDEPVLRARFPSSSETSTSSSSDSDEDRGIKELAETCGVELQSIQTDGLWKVRGGKFHLASDKSEDHLKCGVRISKNMWRCIHNQRFVALVVKNVSHS